ncbi:MAG TPA: sensor domain-containing diguanylate cyclase [Erysipelotrichaceae bacterium]|nr:sensor domain-containing diguanylate cyclase [Erysipelotrichaceae bacterium]
MKLDTQTLIFILSLSLLAQVVALFVQYRIVNKSYKGIEFWLLGSTFMVFGFVFMPLVNVESLQFLAMISNPLMVLGQVIIYFGIVRFLEEKEHRGMLSLIYIVFIFFYYYFMFFNNDISSRSIVINIALSIISILTAYKLFIEKNKFISTATRFSARVFFIYGIFLTSRIFWTMSVPRVQNYVEYAAFLNSGFIVSTLASTLWTFGFILMVNQRLNEDNRIEKEKLQLVFNTGPDAAMITRLSDGLFIDVNVVFTALTGYSRDEVIGNTLININFWHNTKDREELKTKLIEQGFCENMEFISQRKDHSQYDAMISARIINIQDVAHVVSIVRDITERKLAEHHIQELVQQLENEKNTAQLNSITDSMTGLMNRRYFDIALNKEFYRLKRSGAILSLIMIDVDYFKKFNDCYGHLAGDDCLVQIGSMLKKIVGRATDIVARYGGEEFVVILPETDFKGAEILAEKIREAVEKLYISHADSDISEYVTISLGVVSVYPSKLFSPKQVVALADEALYSAKNKGRNQTVLSKERYSDLSGV